MVSLYCSGYWAEGSHRPQSPHLYRILVWSPGSRGEGSEGLFSQGAQGDGGHNPPGHQEAHLSAVCNDLIPTRPNGTPFEVSSCSSRIAMSSITDESRSAQPGRSLDPRY